LTRTYTSHSQEMTPSYQNLSPGSPPALSPIPNLNRCRSQYPHTQVNQTRRYTLPSTIPSTRISPYCPLASVPSITPATITNSPS
jgi:hypothetical protein